MSMAGHAVVTVGPTDSIALLVDAAAAFSKVAEA